MAGPLSATEPLNAGRLHGEIRKMAIPITFYKLRRRRLRHAADSDFRNSKFFLLVDHLLC